MSEYKSKSQNRTRNVRSIIRTIQPIISKHIIDFPAGDAHQVTSFKTSKKHNSYIISKTILDCIITKLKKNHKTADILLMITPASKHPNLYKLHVIHREKHGHVGMTSITQKELANLRSSKAFHKYCIVFGSRYIDLKTVALNTETIKSLVNTLNRNCCLKSKEFALDTSKTACFLKPINSSGGDYCIEQPLKVFKFHNSMMQTEPIELENASRKIPDILQLIKTINNSVVASAKNIEHVFALAEKFNFSLVIRPEMFTKSAPYITVEHEHGMGVHVEFYMPGVSYLGSITMNSVQLLNLLDSYPNLLCNIHVVNDVYDLTPISKKIVNFLCKLFFYLKMEILYDGIGEFLFDWYKNVTFL